MIWKNKTKRWFAPKKELSPRQEFCRVWLVGFCMLFVFPCILAYGFGLLVDPSMRNPYANRMHTACCAGDTGAVQAMIGRGADVNTPVWEDTTALMWATTYLRVDTVKVLIGAGADVNAESSHFGSVSSWGAVNSTPRSHQIAALLKAAGAKL